VAQAEMLAWFAEVFEKVRIGSASVTFDMEQLVMEFQVVVVVRSEVATLEPSGEFPSFL
jgi:hypothetical protein